jgi:hypothetical protein
MLIQQVQGPKFNSNTSKKNEKMFRAGRVAQEIECLPSNHEALSSNPSATKKKKKVLKPLAIREMQTKNTMAYQNG